MRRLVAWGAAALAVAACSPIADLDGVIAIEVRSPLTQTIDVGDTIVLDAVALNGRGDIVPDAPVVWAILDVDSGQVGITLDSLTGTVAGTMASTNRVQGRVETLRTSALTITVVDTVTPVPDFP